MKFSMTTLKNKLQGSVILTLKPPIQSYTYWWYCPLLRSEDRQILGLITSITKFISYEVLLNEILPYLESGEIKMGGKSFIERRMTALFSFQNSPMNYSGRIVQPKIPQLNTIIYQILGYVNSTNFRQEISGLGLTITLPIFNAIFVNWYRPPSGIPKSKDDGLGFHSDDESSLSSDIILSITFCEINGERLFRIRTRYNDNGSIRTSGYDWEAEPKDKSILIMLPIISDNPRTV